MARIADDEHDAEYRCAVSFAGMVGVELKE